MRLIQHLPLIWKHNVSCNQLCVISPIKCRSGTTCITGDPVCSALLMSPGLISWNLIHSITGYATRNAVTDQLQLERSPYIFFILFEIQGSNRALYSVYIPVAFQHCPDWGLADELLAYVYLRIRVSLFENIRVTPDWVFFLLDTYCSGPAHKVFIS